MLHILILNYRKKVRGPMLDKWVELPRHPADLARDLDELKVIDSHDYAIADSRSDLNGLSACISPSDSIGELNELAGILQRGDYDRPALESYIRLKQPTVQELLILFESQNMKVY